MKKSVHGIPFTGTNTAMKPTPSVKTTQNTSRDAEKIVRQPPQPFQNKNNIKNLPIDARKESYDTDYTGPNKALIGTKIGAKGLPNLKDAGYKRPPNYSGQGFSRMGKPGPRKVGQNGGGFPSRRNARFFGEA